MCQRHSFCVTPQGKVLDGLGLTDSHTKIMSLHGLESGTHDACNLFEWQPPAGWPETSWINGLTVDHQAFTPKKSHDKASEAHLRALYPSIESWESGDVIRWGNLDLPDVDRVHRAYDLAVSAAPIGVVSDGEVIQAVDEHLRRLGLDVRVTEVVTLSSVRDSVRDSVGDSVGDSVWDSVRDSVWASVWASVRDSVWDSVGDSVWDSVRDSVWASVWASVRDSVWDSVWGSVLSSMVVSDDENAFLPLSELATKGAYLYGVTNDGVAYIIREAAE